MVAFISQRRPLLGAAALVVSLAMTACGGGPDGSKPTETSSPEPSATAQPTDAPTATPPSVKITGFGILDGIPVTEGISALTFVTDQSGWATNTCETQSDFLFCDILTTRDGGKTWRVQYRGTGRLVRIQFLDPQTGFAFGNESGVVATTDGGETWTDVSERPPPGLHDVQFAAVGSGFALASGVIFQLDYGKKAWVFNYGSPDCSFSSISFRTADEGWAGGGGKDGVCLFRTSDAGKSWTAVIRGSQSQTLETAISNGAPEDGRWESILLNGPFDCHSGAPKFYSSRLARLPIVCQMGDGFTLRTTDGGDSWQYDSEQTACLMGCQTYRYQSGDSGYAYNLDLLRAWQRTAHNEISWSVDGGKTWNKVSGPELCCDSDNIFFVDANHGWIVFGEHIARTTDGGRTWERLPVTILP